MILKSLPSRIEHIIKTGVSDRDIITKIINIINAGKRNIILGQFIPTDKNGKPLEKPKPEDYGGHNTMGFDYPKDLEEYETALSKVLFKGWELKYPFDNEPVILLVCGKITLYYDFDENMLYDDEIGFERVYTTIESISNLELVLTEAGEKKLL